ncbi:alpha-1,4-glucan--maltose-1-phosphate maltosyltransferase, partial [Mycobacterium sp. ITM-2017-0098]
DAVGLWTFRVDGWGDPIATWRKHVIAKLEAGQSEGELDNDLLLGAKLLDRAATGVARQDRYPLAEAAARLREPGDPFYRAGGALA